MPSMMALLNQQGTVGVLALTAGRSRPRRQERRSRRRQQCCRHRRPRREGINNRGRGGASDIAATRPSKPCGQALRGLATATTRTRHTAARFLGCAEGGSRRRLPAPRAQEGRVGSTERPWAGDIESCFRPAEHTGPGPVAVQFGARSGDLGWVGDGAEEQWGAGCGFADPKQERPVHDRGRTVRRRPGRRSRRGRRAQRSGGSRPGAAGPASSQPAEAARDGGEVQEPPARQRVNIRGAHTSQTVRWSGPVAPGPHARMRRGRMGRSLACKRRDPLRAPR